jgi:3-oxoacyl-[acyl-carrier-protein] synthase-3
MKVYLNSIACHLPEKVLTNARIADMHPGWSVDKISAKLGIDSRHVAADGETSSDLAREAAKKLFDEFDVDPAVIDHVVFCTQSPDYFLPSSACLLQHRLGIPDSAGAFDFNLGCSGYIYGLGIAKGLISTRQASRVLLLTGETYTKFINERDKGNKTLFGDAGTATLVSSAKTTGGLNAEIKEFCYGTDGSRADTLIVRNGGMRHRAMDGRDRDDAEGEFAGNDNDLFMDGRAIFDFAVFQVPPLVERTLAKNGLALADVDEFIFHQANRYMLETVRKRCAIERDRFYVDIATIGNTVSNTIPIALRNAFREGVLENRRNVLLVGFGVGLSMGAVALNFDRP